METKKSGIRSPWPQSAESETTVFVGDDDASIRGAVKTLRSVGLRALQAGAVEFLAKPFQKELLTAVHQALERDKTRWAEGAELSALQSRIDLLNSREREVFDIGVLNKMASPAFGRPTHCTKLYAWLSSLSSPS